MKQIRFPAQTLEERVSPIIHIEIIPMQDNKMVILTESGDRFERSISDVELASVIALIEPAVTEKIAEAVVEDVPEPVPIAEPIVEGVIEQPITP